MAPVGTPPLGGKPGAAPPRVRHLRARPPSQQAVLYTNPNKETSAPQPKPTTGGMYVAPMMGSSWGVRNTLIGQPPRPVSACTYVICRRGVRRMTGRPRPRGRFVRAAAWLQQCDRCPDAWHRAAALRPPPGRQSADLRSPLRSTHSDPPPASHVHPVDVRPLLPVDLDGHKVAVEQRRRLLALKRLALHHVAPAGHRREGVGVGNAPARRRAASPRMCISMSHTTVAGCWTAHGAERSYTVQRTLQPEKNATYKTTRPTSGTSSSRLTGIWACPARAPPQTPPRPRGTSPRCGGVTIQRRRAARACARVRRGPRGQEAARQWAGAG